MAIRVMINAYSTAEAPDSSASWWFITFSLSGLVLEVEKWPQRQRRGHFLSCLISRCRGVGTVDARAGVVEDAVEGVAQEQHRRHDDRRDQGDEQAVLDGGRTALVVTGPEVLLKNDELTHVNLP